MKNIVISTLALVTLISCTINSNAYPIRNSIPNNTEIEYNSLIKTYKPETAEVLNDLLNDDSPSNTRTSITVENQSPCNMVLTISGTNYYKKIPIAAGKIGYAMLTKNQTYKLSGRLCQSVYQSSKYITTSYSVKLSN